MRDFFTKAGGSIAVSEALCITHRVDIRKDNRSSLKAISSDLYKTIYKREGYKVEKCPSEVFFLLCLPP